MGRVLALSRPALGNAAAQTKTTGACQNPPTETSVDPGRELPSVDQGPGTGDETLRLAWAGPTVPVCFGSIRQHFGPRRHLISAPEWRTEMTNRFAVWTQIITAAAA